MLDALRFAILIFGCASWPQMAQDAWREDTAASTAVQLEAQQSGDAIEALHMGDAMREQNAVPARQGR